MTTENPHEGGKNIVILSEHRERDREPARGVALGAVLGVCAWFAVGLGAVAVLRWWVLS